MENTNVNINRFEYNVTLATSMKEEEATFSPQAFVTVAVTVIIIVTNCAVIVAAAWTDTLNNFNKTFLYSLTLADLLTGLFITPYSILLSVYRKWIFAGYTLCSVVAYAYTTLTMVKIYSLTWINVDHYLAIRKPERYHAMMSPTRSLCWIGFSWLVAVSYCCPLLFSFESAAYNESVFICMVDCSKKTAYMVTAWVIASLPSVLALGITNAYLFTSSFKDHAKCCSNVSAGTSSRPLNYHMTSIMCVLLVLVWIPFLVIIIIKALLRDTIMDAIQFYSFWLGLCSSFSHFFVLLLMSASFRRALRSVCQLRACYDRCCLDSGGAVDVTIITLPKK